MNWADWVRATVAIASAAVAIAFFLALAWAGVNATRTDREHRSVVAEQCQTIENEAVRSECIRAAR